jgi:selenocysteine lyase/cysteine desulfurase
MAKMAREVGALVYVDAVHYAPHGPLDVNVMGADFVVASAYKFFGPHVGILWGRKAHLNGLPARKVRPAYDRSPDRWMTGTPNFEGIVGAAECVRYIADLAVDAPGDLRARIAAGYAEIQRYERSLTERFLALLAERPGFRLWGISSPGGLIHRVPTFSLTHETSSPKTLAKGLAQAGIFAWSGDHYAVPFTQSVGLVAEGTLRIGLLHYNTEAEIERCFTTLDALTGAA